MNVLEFLNRPNSKELVSGTMDCVNLYEKFRSKYEQLFPGSIESLEQQAEARKLQNQKACMWDTITDVKTGGFKFGFCECHIPILILALKVEQFSPWHQYERQLLIL